MLLFVEDFCGKYIHLILRKQIFYYAAYLPVLTEMTTKCFSWCPFLDQQKRQGGLCCVLNLYFYCKICVLFHLFFTMYTLIKMCRINNKGETLPVQTSFLSSFSYGISSPIHRPKSEVNVPYSTVICLEKKSLHFISFLWLHYNSIFYTKCHCNILNIFTTNKHKEKYIHTNVCGYHRYIQLQLLNSPILSTFLIISLLKILK